MSKPQAKLRAVEQTFDVSLFKYKGDNEPKPQSLTWNAFVKLCGEPVVRPAKDGALFSPATFKGLRDKDNVIDVCMLGLDYDKRDDLESDVAVWSELGYRFAVYTTHSHLRKTKTNPNAKKCFRIILPLATPIPVKDFLSLWKWAADKTDGAIDAAPKSPAQMFYLPAKASEDAPYRFEEHKGSLLLDWRTLDLKKYSEEEKSKTQPRSVGASEQVSIEDAHLPQAKFDLMLDLVPKFRASWERQNPELKDQTPSNYILSLLNQAALYDWSTQEALALKLAWFEKHKIDEPLKETLRKFNNHDWPEALRWAASQKTKSEATNRRASQLVAADNDATPITDTDNDNSETEIIVDSCDEDANARRFVRQHGDLVLYCKQWKSWLVYDGKRWRKDITDSVVLRAKITARSILAEAQRAIDDKQSEQLIKWSKFTKSGKGLREMLWSSQSELPALADEFDADSMLLNCANGTLDLRTEHLRAHDRSDKLTKLINVEYDPDAKCPQWMEFIYYIMGGNERLITFLRRAVGYSLTGNVSERVMFILYGRGKNGKSVFCETINELLAEYAQTTPASALMAKRESAASNDIASLKGARFVFANETEENKRLDEAGIKNVTGDDTISARFLYSEFFKFKPQFKMWLRTNHKPVIRGTDDGIWDRLKLIPFTVRITEAQQDKNLSKKLEAELPGILAWAVRGCLEWQRDGLGVPAEVEQATQKYRNEQDNFANFIDECCIISETAWTPTATLRTTYENWCKGRGELPTVGGNAFAERLQSLNFSKKKARHAGSVVHGWQGVGIE